MPTNTDSNSRQNKSFVALAKQYLWSTVYFWVPAGIFILLANEVREREPLPGDVAVLKHIHTFASSSLDTFFVFITTLGSAPVVAVGVAVAAATLYYTGRRRDALFLFVAAGGTAVINFILKLIFTRTRPDLWDRVVTETDYSFPSGHAMITSALALTVILLTWRTKYRWLAVVGGTLYMLLVGLSRLYLGVHFPSDILAGWCVSILWVLTIYHVRFRQKSDLGTKKTAAESQK